MKEQLTWGILATGTIARTFTRGLARSKTGRALAVGSRTREAAERFGAEFDIPRQYGSYDALLADRDVQAVYIATPHPMHAAWAIRAAEAGKHILCEKPIGLNHAEAMAIVEAARRHDVFLMEAFMYRCHPQTEALVHLIYGKAIGDVRAIQATFSFRGDFALESRILSNAYGGGGILDVGCYCASMARLVAGAAMGWGFAEPVEVAGAGHIGEESRVDECAVASLRFPGGIVASLATGVRVNQENVVRIFGTEGYIVVPEPWIPARDGGTTHILIHRPGEDSPSKVTVEAELPLYAIEADTVAANLHRREAPPPAMTWDDTLGNMKTLDRWRAAIGMIYDAEKPEAHAPPVHRRSLAVGKPNTMQYDCLLGVGLPIARLIMRADHQTTMPHAAVMFDDYFERGGNCFDTAPIYAGGACERLLGQWIRDRGVRAKVVLLGKGAHTPFCNPNDLSRQLAESLERLQTDYLDICMLHRDNPDVPVGEFIDVLHEHRNAGRVRAFGASNWTIDRIEAANRYAQSKGLTGLAAVSNQFSLARMVEPPWPGCFSVSDPPSRTWFARTQMPLMAWSSQAQGFFAARPEGWQPDNEWRRCWDSRDNFDRIDRAGDMADKRNTTPHAIALAYVLCQPFPTFALIGPRTLAETREAMAALDLELTPDECAWLNLER